MIVKRFVCLANSRKLSGRCLAGLTVDGRKDWIRPISNREHEEVSERERQYEDGSDPQVLDIIDVPLLKPRPRDFQQENWLLDPNHYWTKVGKVKADRLEPYCQVGGTLWTNGESTYHGLNDQIALENANRLQSSLALIYSKSVMLRVLTKGELFDNPKKSVQAQFMFGDTEYRLWVTDPNVERTYLAKENGIYAVGNCFLTVSLGEPWKGNTYKLVAAIIPAKTGAVRP